MTTFTTRAIYDRATYNQQTDEFTTLEARSVDVKILMPDGANLLSYVVDNFDSDEDEFDISVNFPAGAQLMLDGQVVDNLDDYNTDMQSLVLNGQNITILSIGYYNSLTGMDHYYTMSVAGAQLPNITSVAQYEALSDSVSAFFTTLTPDPGPGNTVNLNTVPGVTVSQNDMFFAVGANDGSFGASGEDFFVGGQGNDTVNMGADNVEYVQLDYSKLAGGITANINSVANTGSITKNGIGTDTLIDVANPMLEGWNNGGLALIGGRGNDNITLRTSTQTWSEVRSSSGDDSITLLGAANSVVRLNYRSGGAGDGDPASGIVANLATGSIQDGRGGTDTINRAGFAGTMELRGTYLNDLIMGSSGDDRFILEAGNDTLDGGAGHDTVRYDRSGVTELNIDFGTGIATGMWGGRSFTHTARSIEEVYGNREGTANITAGDGDANWTANNAVDTTFTGGMGNDTFNGAGGYDVAIYDVAINDVGISFDQDANTFTVTSADGGTDTYNTDVDEWNFAGTAYYRFDMMTRDGQTPGQTYVAQNKTDYSERYEGTTGSNTIDMTAITTGSIMLDYGNVADDATFNINGPANTGTISKGYNGVQDTLINVAGPLSNNDTGGIDIRGTDYDDTFNITSNANSWNNLYGAAGFDAFNLSGAGTFRISYGFEQGLNGVTVNLQTGTVLDDGHNNMDTITYTGTGSLQLEGSSMADSITGSTRDDVLIGRGGNDTVDGASGTDLLRFDRAGVSGLTVDLGAGTAAGTWDGAGFTNSLTSIENIRGTRDGNDNITGSAVANDLRAYAGNDILSGGGGDDTMRGGKGDDVIAGGAGNDRVVIDAASTDIDVILGTYDITILSADGIDVVSTDVENFQFNDRTIDLTSVVSLVGQVPSQVGLLGYDHLIGDGADELLFGVGGNDWITPGNGDDTVDGGDGTDMLNLGTYGQAVIVDLGAGTVRSGADTKIVSNIENVTGSIYSDFLTGDAGDNWMRALGGYDWFITTDGNDTYDGSNGRDMVTYIYADEGVTVDLGQQRGLSGQAATHTYVEVERATGSIHADVFYGSDGSDEFRGAGGYDVFYDSEGRDRYDGGTGLDTVDYSRSAGGVNASLLRGSGGPNYDLYLSIENLNGSRRDDALTGDHGRNVLRGWHGDDALNGMGGNDYLEGGSGNDVMDGGAGYDVALYRNAASQYTVSTVGDVTTVTHAVDGIDTLTNIEALRFTDGFDYI